MGYFRRGHHAPPPPPSPAPALVPAPQPAPVSQPAPQPAPPPAPRASHVFGTFGMISGIAAVFAGIATYTQTPDPLPAAIAAGVTFAGAWIALHVLNAVFRIASAVGKLVIPVALVLFVGSVLDWPWAHTAVDFIAAGWDQGVEVARGGWQALSGSTTD